MDVVLGGFLAWVRPRARPAHLSTYEELAWQLDTFLRQQPRARRMRSAALCGFVGSWYARECRLEGRSARRFCAALRVLARWLGRDADPVRARRMRLVVARAAREAVRATQVSELLETHAPRHRGATVGGRDGWWEVVMRGDSHIVVRAVGEARLVGPVVLPHPVLRRVSAGTVLNLRLLPESDHWCVVDHGPCYPSVAWLSERLAADPATA
jgi:hypothetical protein